MLAVLEGFGVIAVVIAVGAIVGRTGVLGDNARTVLNRVAFHIGVPALLLMNLSKASIGQIFSLPVLLSAMVALIMMGLCFGIVTVVRRRRPQIAPAIWSGAR